MSHESIAMRVAEAVCAAEIKNSRTLGADWLDSYASGFRALDDTYNMALDPMPKAVWPRAGTISRTGFVPDEN